MATFLRTTDTSKNLITSKNSRAARFIATKSRSPAASDKRTQLHRSQAIWPATGGGIAELAVLTAAMSPRPPVTGLCDFERRLPLGQLRIRRMLCLLDRRGQITGHRCQLSTGRVPGS